MPSTEEGSDSGDKKRLLGYLRNIADGKTKISKLSSKKLDEIQDLIDRNLLPSSVSIRGINTSDLEHHIKIEKVSRGDTKGASGRQKAAGGIIRFKKERDKLARDAERAVKNATKVAIMGSTGSPLAAEAASRVVAGTFRHVDQAASNPIGAVKNVLVKVDNIILGKKSDAKRAFSDWVKRNGKKHLSKRERRTLALSGGFGAGAKIRKKLAKIFQKETGLKL